MDEAIIQKTTVVSAVIMGIACILHILCLVLHFSTHLMMVTIFLYGISIPIVHTYYIDGALLKKANGDVWKNVVIGGGLLGGLTGGIYWIFMGKNIPETHLGAVFGISFSVVMFGTILAGVLLAMAINRGAFLRIILVLIVGAACYHCISLDYIHIKGIYPWLFVLLSIPVSMILVPLLWNYPLCMYIIFIFIPMCGYTLISNYNISFLCGIWPPIAGAYWGTVPGGMWIYIISY